MHRQQVVSAASFRSGSGRSHCVLDMQCYFDNQMKYVVKELSIYDLNTYALQHWIFKPPEKLVIHVKKARQANFWVSKNLHQIPWHGGDVNYSELDKILDFIASSFDVVYVKGRQKVDYLKEKITSDVSTSVTTNVKNVEDEGCPKMELLLEPNWLLVGSHCMFHRFKPMNCSSYKVKSIARWLTFH